MGFLGRPDSFFTVFLSVISIFGFFTAFFSFLSFFAVVVTVLILLFDTIFTRSFLFLHISSSGIVNGKHGGSSTGNGSLFVDIFFDKAISLGVGLRHDGGQPGSAGDWHIDGEFIPSNKGFLMVCHIERAEQGISQVFELVVAFVHHVAIDSIFGLEVDEGDRVFVDADVSDKVLEVTVGSVVHILEETVLKSRVFFFKLIVAYFISNFVADNVLIAEHVTYLAFVYRHTALISPVHGAAGMTVPVLHVIVLFFRELS
jgi:hypothetical protein